MPVRRTTAQPNRDQVKLVQAIKASVVRHLDAYAEGVAHSKHEVTDEDVRRDARVYVVNAVKTATRFDLED